MLGLGLSLVGDGIIDVVVWSRIVQPLHTYRRSVLRLSRCPVWSLFCVLCSIQTYVHVPDWKIPLTKKGFGDGQKAGEKIKEYIGDKPLFIYTSPYLRTKQVCHAWCDAM